MVFANLDGLFAFHTSTEDARYLVPELGEGVDEQDLVEFGEYQCYAKLSAGGERLPVFSVRLDPPAPSPPATRDLLAAMSAGLYGRPWPAVESDVRSALARIELARRVDLDGGQAGQPGTGVTKERSAPGQDQAGKPAKPRSEKRLPTHPPVEVHQASLFQATDADAGASAGPDAPAPGEGEAPAAEEGES